MRRLRRRHDDEALVEERLVPRLLQLPQVQEHPRSRARRQRIADARDGRRLRQVRKAHGDPQRPLRRVLVVHRLPGLQEREAGAAVGALPEVRWRHHRGSLQEEGRQDLLRVLELQPGVGEVRSSLAEALEGARPPLQRPFLVMGGTKAKPISRARDRSAATSARRTRLRRRATRRGARRPHRPNPRRTPPTTRAPRPERRPVTAREGARPAGDGGGHLGREGRLVAAREALRRSPSARRRPVAAPEAARRRSTQSVILTA